MEWCIRFREFSYRLINKIELNLVDGHAVIPAIVAKVTIISCCLPLQAYGTFHLVMHSFYGDWLGDDMGRIIYSAISLVDKAMDSYNTKSGVFRFRQASCRRRAAWSRPSHDILPPSSYGFVIHAPASRGANQAPEV